RRLAACAASQATAARRRFRIARTGPIRLFATAPKQPQSLPLCVGMRRRAPRPKPAISTVAATSPVTGWVATVAATDASANGRPNRTSLAGSHLGSHPWTAEDQRPQESAFASALIPRRKTTASTKPWPVSCFSEPIIAWAAASELSPGLAFAPRLSRLHSTNHAPPLRAAIELACCWQDYRRLGKLFGLVQGRDWGSSGSTWGCWASLPRRLSRSS